MRTLLRVADCRSEIKINPSQRFADLAMVIVTLVDDLRAIPLPDRRPMQFNASSQDSEEIERPLGMLLSTLIAMNRRIPKRNGEPSDLGHHMERHEKVEKDGKHA